MILGESSASHPTGKGLNKPQLVVGIELRFLGGATLLPVLINGVYPSWKVALALFFVMCCMGRYLSHKDPNIVRVVMTRWRQKNLYDPLKRAYFRARLENLDRG